MQKQLFVFPALILAIAGNAQAATDTWAGNTSGNWNTAANWSGNVVPSNGDTLSFASPGTSGISLTDNITSLTVGGSNTDGIDFTAGSGAYSIAPSSATLTLASTGSGRGISDVSINGEAISVPLTFNSTQIINVGSSNGDSADAKLTLSGGISGGAGVGLTKTGGGVLILSSASTFGTGASPGVITVTGGVLSITNDNQLGTDPSAATAGNIVLDGGTLRTTSSLNGNRGIALGDSGAGTGGTIDTANSTSTISGIISNNGGTNSLTKTGAGNLILTGINTYTGSTIINQGQLTIDTNSSSTASINSASTLVMGGTSTVAGVVADGNYPSLELQGNNSTSTTQTFNGLVLNAGNSQIESRTINNSDPTTIALNGITHNAGGVLSLSLTSNGNTGTGNVTTTTANDATGILGGWAVINNTNPNSGNFQTPTDYATVNGSGNIVAYTGYATQAAGAISSGTLTNARVSTAGGVALTVASGTTYLNTLSNAGTATGTTTITIASGGTLNFGPQGGMFTSSGSGGITTSGGSITAGGSTANNPGTIYLVGESGAFTIGSNIVNNGTGAVTLVVDQTNNQTGTFTGTNTYSGGTYLDSGRNLANSNTAFGTGTVYIGSAAQAYLNFSGTMTNAFNIIGASTGSNDTPSAIRFQGGQILSGAITLAGDAVITGSGTLTGQITGNYDLLSEETFNGAGAGTLVLANTGTANNYGGNTYVQAGTLQLGASNQIPDGANAGNLIIVNFNNGGGAGGTFNLAGFSDTINGLSGTSTAGQGTVTTTTGTSTLTVGANNQSSTFNGAIQNSSGTLNLVKIGSGTLTLGNTTTTSTNDSYSGATTVNAGVLLLTGVLNGSTAIAANSGGTFTEASTGTLAGSVSVGASGGTVNLNGTNSTTGATTASNGGTLNLFSTISGGGAVTGNAGGTIVENSAAVISGGSTVTANGGAVNLSGANTYTGATAVTGGGTLTLDFTQTGAPTTNIVNNTANTSTLALNSGTLVLKGNAGTTNSQQFNGTTVTSGSTITLNANATSNPLLLSLGAITRTSGVGGTINFILPTGTQSASNGITTSNTNNANGTLLDFTVGGTDWAAVSGGNIVSYTSNGGTYTAAGNTASAYTNANVDVLTSATPNGAITPNSLRFNTATPAILTLQSGSTNVISSGGILETTNVGANNTAIVGGTLEGSASTSLDVMQNDASGTLTLATVIANNGGATGLNVSGPGTVLLTGNNSYSGTTTVGSGSTLLVGNGLSTGNGSLGLNSNQNITLDGGTLIENRTDGVSFGAITANANSTIGYVNGATFLNQQYNINAGSNVLTYAGSLGSTYGLASTNGYSTTLGGEMYLNGITLTASQFNITSGAVALNNNNTISAPINVASGATLGGYSGTGISANLTFNGGGGAKGLGAYAQQSGSSTLSGTITLASGVTSFDTAAGNTTISGVVTGSGGLAKSNINNTLTLTNAANTYTGITSVDGGTLQLTFSGAGSNMLYNGVTAGTLSLGGAPSATSYQNNSLQTPTFSITGAGSQNNSQTFANTVANFGTDTITALPGSSGGILLNLGALTHNTGGVLNFTNNTVTSSPTATDAITATGTTLSNGIIGGWATVGGSDFATINASGQIIGLSNTGSGGAGYTASTGVIANGAGTNVSDSSTSASTGSGTTTINAVRFTGGGTTLTLGGTLDVGPSGGILNSTGNLTINSGTLTTVSGGGNITVNDAGNTLNIGSNITDNGGAVSLTLVEGTGAQSGITGANTYSGGTVIAGGRWQFGSSSIGTGLVTVLDGGEAFLNGGTFSNNFAVEGTGASENDGSIRTGNTTTINGTITVLGDTRITQQNGSLTLNGQITGNGAIDFNDVNAYANIILGNTGTGSSANNWTGNTIIDNPVVQAAANQIPSGANAGNLTVDSSGNSGGTNTSYLNLGGFNLAINGLSGTGMVENTTGTAQFSIGNNNQSFSAGNLLTDSTGSLTLVKSGTGIVALTNNSNAYHGGTIVNGGTLQVGAANALGAATGALAVNTGGVLDLNNNNLTVGALSGTTGGVISSYYQGTATALTLTVNNTAGTTKTFAGSIQNGTATSVGLALASTNTGTTDLTGANLYTGSTTIAGGSLQIGYGGSISNNSLVNLSNSASLILGDSNGAVSQTFNNLTTTSGTPIVGGASTASTVTLNGAGTVTYANAFGGATGNQNNLNLVIAGTGVTPVSALSGTSSYTGTTTVNSGATLSLTGQLGATAMTVNSGGTLAGGGTTSSKGVTGGTITAVGGSTISLINGAGHLTTTGAITLGSTGAYGASNYTTLIYNLGSSNAVESLNTGGTLTINSGGVYVDIVNPTILGTYTLATYSDGTAPGGFSLSSTTANVTTLNSGGDTATLTISGSSLIVTVTGAATPGLAYFDGAQAGAAGKIWNTNNSGSTNFSSNVAGTTDAGNIAGSTTDVILNANNATTNQGNPLTETLGGTTIINSLRVNSNGTTTIGADGNTLTIIGNADSNIVSDGTFTAGSQTAGTGIVIASGASAFTINTPIVVNSGSSTSATQTWTNNSANLFTVGGSITGSAIASTTLALANTGAGGTTVSGAIADGAGQTLSLVVNNTGTGLTTLTSSANSYSGGTTLKGGTLTSAVSGGFGAGSVTVNPSNVTSTSADNATLNTTGSIASIAAVTVNSEASDGGFGIGTINFNGSTPTIGSLSGNGSVVLNNASGTNLTVGSTNNLSSTFSGVISNGAGTGSLTKAGTGTFTLTGANTYSGTTAVTAGVLAMGPGGSFANTTSITLGSGAVGGTLQLGTSSGIDNLTLTGATPITGSGTATNSIVGGNSSISTLTINSSSAYALGTSGQNLVLGGAGTNQDNLALSITGSGTVTIGNDNQYTGGTSVSNGTLVVTTINGLGANTSASTVSIGSAGIVNIQSAGSVNYNYTFTGGGRLLITFPNGGSDTQFTNFNAFSGTIEVGSANGGSNKLVIQAPVLTALSTATLQIDNGGQLFMTSNNVNFGNITIVGTGNNEGRGAIRLNTGTLGGNVSLLGNATIGNEGGTLTGNISTGVAGTSTLTMGTGNSSGTAMLTGNLTNGTGILALTEANGTTTLSGANSYTGATTINSGSGITAGSTGAFSSTSAVTDNGTLTTTGFNTTIGSLTGAGTVTLGSATLSIGGDNTSPAAFSGVIGGSGGSLVKIGTGTLALSGPNTYSGTTTVENGSLLAAANAPAGAAGAFGNTTSAIALGDSTSISNNLSPTLLVSGAAVGQSITVGASNGGTSGIYTIGGLSDTVAGSSYGFTGNLTLNQSLTVSQIADTSSSNGLTVTGNITSGSSGTQVVNFAGPGNIFVNTGVIGGGTGTIGVLNSGATTTLSGINTYTGTTTVSSGTLIAGSNSAFGSGASPIVMGDANTGATAVPTLLTGGSVTVAKAVNVTSLAVSGATIGGNTDNNSTFSGLITTDANLTISQVANAGSNALTISGGITQGSATVGAPYLVSFAGPGNINVTTSAITDGGDGSLSVAVTGGNTTFAVANTYSGITYIDGGTLTAGTSNVIGSNSVLDVGDATGGSVAIANGTLALGSNNDTVFSLNLGTSSTTGTISGTGTLTSNGQTFGLENGEIDAVLAGTSGLVKSTTATVVLKGANTFTGATSFLNGSLQLENQNALQNSTVTPLGATSIVFDSSVSAHAFTFGGLSGSHPLVLTDNGSNAVALSVGNNNASTTYTGLLSGSGSLIKIGTGTLALTTASSTFAGSTAVNQGVLSFTLGNASATAAQSLGENSTLTLGVAGTSSGTLTYKGAVAGTLAKNINVLGNGSDTIINGAASTGKLLTLSGTLTKANTTLTLSGGTSGIKVTGLITGGTTGDFNSDLNIVNGATTLSAANSYTGPTNVYNAGDLLDGIANAVPTGSVLTLGNAGDGAVTNTFDLNGFGQTVAALDSVSNAGSTNNNIVTNSGASGVNTLTLSGVNSDSVAVSSTYGGVIQNGAHAQTALTVSGGTHTFSGTNTYTGATTVNAGNLIISGSTASGSAVSVNAGTLTANGTVGGTVAVASGATLTGTGSTGFATISGGGIIGLQNGSIGTLTVGGLSTGQAGTPSSFTFDIGSSLGSNDMIADNGTLTLNGVGGTTITIGNATGVSTLASGLYNLITYTGTYTGSLSDLTLSTTTLDGQTLSLVQGSGVIELQVSAGASGTAYFNGVGNDLNTASNFDTSASSGSPVGSIGTASNVFFAANRNGSTTPNISAPLEVNSVNFGAGTTGVQSGITVSSTNTSDTLTVDATGANGNTAGSGITVASGSDTISAPVVLGGSQSWTTTGSTTSLNVSGQVSGAYALTKAGTGGVTLSNPTGNIYTGGTTVNAGTLYVTNTSNSGTGTGAVTVNSGGTLAGNGFISTTSGVAINGGGSLISGSRSQISGTGLASLGGMSLVNTALTVGSSVGTANLTFDLAAGNSGIGGGSAGFHTFANPNNNTTYLSLNGSSSINFAGATSISLVDLTNTNGHNGSLALLTGTPYLLIHAASNSEYLNLVINSGTDANPILSLSQNDTNATNGYVLGVWAGGSNPLTDYTAISIAQYGADGVTPLVAGPGGTYPAPALYLDAGNLEVVPEPGTWALMIGGLALLVVIQRRRKI